MGLLDDAIREHLELKRRSGADPGEIAHKEHEALAPVFPDEEAIVLEEPPHEADDVPGEQSDFAHVGQETAELDMSEVLDEERPQPSAAPAPARPAPVTSESPADSLEWELSPGLGGGDSAPAPQEIPGQERLTFE